MTFALLLPTILSFLALVAHFLHHDSVPMAALCVLVPFLLLIRHWLIPWLMRLLLVMAAIEWLATIPFLVDEYEQMGRPWMRAAIILAAVAVFTLASGLLFATPPLRRRYSGKTKPASAGFDPTDAGS